MTPSELKSWLKGYLAAGGTVPKEVQEAIEGMQEGKPLSDYRSPTSLSP